MSVGSVVLWILIGFLIAAISIAIFVNYCPTSKSGITVFVDGKKYKLYGNAKGSDLKQVVGKGGIYTYYGAVIRDVDVLSRMGIRDGANIKITNGDVENITLKPFIRRHYRGIRIKPSGFGNRKFDAVYDNDYIVGSIDVGDSGKGEIDRDNDRVTVYDGKNVNLTSNVENPDDVFVRKLENNKKSEPIVE